MADEALIIEEVVAVQVTTALVPDQRRLSLYLFGGLLMLLINVGDPALGLINIPASFFLKNKLHLGADQQAIFRVWTGVPLYLSLVFGFLRDRWSPFGRGDSGHLVVFGLATASAYAVVAFLPPTYAVWMAGIILATSIFQIVSGAAAGLLSTVGQQRAMAGRMSALIGIAASAPPIVSNLAGGALSGMLEGKAALTFARTLFLIAAGVMAVIALLGFIRPRSLFDAAVVEKPTEHFFEDVKRLARHWPIYPVAIIQLLWQFAPGTGLVLQYYMADHLHGTDFEWGIWNAVFLGSFVPVYVLYGFLCQRFELSKLLWGGFILAVFQMVPMLFATTAVQAIFAAVGMGLIGGIAQAALTDLAIRSCPARLQGTMMLLFATSMYWIAVRFGDLLGAQIYAHWGGFYVAVAVTIAIYALILPVLLLVPKRLITTKDGEALAA
jgi:MFS family permease